MSDQARPPLNDPLTDEALEGKSDGEVAEIVDRESRFWFTFAATVTVRAAHEDHAREVLNSTDAFVGDLKGGSWGPLLQIGDLTGVERLPE